MFYCPNKSIYYFFKINTKISTSFRRSMLISFWIDVPGADQGGGRTRCAPLPYNWKKYDFFGVKSWFFTRNTPKIFAPPSARRNFFKCAPPNFKSWIRPWNVLTRTVNIWFQSKVLSTKMYSFSFIILWKAQYYREKLKYFWKWWKAPYYIFIMKNEFTPGF